MREIKFRAWDKVDSWLGKVTSIDFDEETVFIETRTVDDENYFKFDDIEIMQYTGLKDMNGKEIFEGDIVKCFKSHNSLVCFAMYSFGLKTKVRGFEPFYDIYGQCEVIGNIHENPELLEETK